MGDKADKNACYEDGSFLAQCDGCTYYPPNTLDAYSDKPHKIDTEGNITIFNNGIDYSNAIERALCDSDDNDNEDISEDAGGYDAESNLHSSSESSSVVIVETSSAKVLCSSSFSSSAAPARTGDEQSKCAKVVPLYKSSFDD